MPVVDVEYHYAVTYPARGRRRPRAAAVHAAMPVRIEETSAREAPVVAVVEGADNGYRLDGSPALRPPVTIRSFRGGLVVPFDWPEDVVPGPSGLPQLSRDAGTEGDWAEDPHLFTDWGPSTIPPEALGRLGEARSDEAAVRASVLDRASRMCLVDGVLHVPCPKPVFAIRRMAVFGGDRIQALPRISPPSVHAAERLFSLAEADAAAAFAAERARELGIPFQRFGSFSLVDLRPFAYDGLADYGLALFGEIADAVAKGAWLSGERGSNEAFRVASARLRTLLPDVAAGSGQAAREAFEALATLKAEYPASEGADLDFADVVLADPGLDLVLDAHRAFDAGPSPDEKADVDVLLATLGPLR